MPKSPINVARRGRPFFLLMGTLIALLVASTPMSVPAVAEWQHNSKINSTEYKQQYGSWEVVTLPEEFRLNTIHAAALPTGKVLLVAGSGNVRDNFKAFDESSTIKVLKTALLDPETMQVKNIDTPSDLFCSGHAMLHSGNLLIAGGTSGYELLDGQVTKPAGAMLLHNENPDDEPRTIKKGTRLTDETGKSYVTMQTVVLQPATKTGEGLATKVTHSSTKVFVEAVKADRSFITNDNRKYTLDGLDEEASNDIYGQGGPMTLNKQDYRGDDDSYEFDYVKEEYVRTGDLNESRWYPSLPVLTNGNVLAVSGLDNTGQITTTTEQYDPATKEWTFGPDQEFPTYPALFRTQDPNVLFYSGSSAGYGPGDKGRVPGFWNYQTDTFNPVPGLRDPNITETSASVVLPPAKGSNDGSQSSRIMIAGGGGIGESPLSTARTDIIDLAQANPHYKPGPDLPAKLRYVNMTVMPNDTVFASGGTTDYRAKGNSYSYKAVSINPTDNSVLPLADELIGRSYHSGSLLLRDGRVLVFGNDPLYTDKANTTPGKFEQRLEIFTPPEHFRTGQPQLKGADNQAVQRGQTLTFTSQDAASLRTARLLPPSTTTHVTNLEQRSIGAVLSTDGNKVNIKLPEDENVLTNGWYMLFVTNADGAASRALMVEVTDQ